MLWNFNLLWGVLDNLIRHVGEESCITFTWFKSDTVELVQQNGRHCPNASSSTGPVGLLFLGSLNPLPVPVLCQGVKEASGRRHPQRSPLIETGTS